MTLAFQTVTLPFDPTSGRHQRLEGTAKFSSRVHAAEAALRGWSLRFTNGDHNLLAAEVIIDPAVKIVGSAVSFVANILLRDNSGNIDDPYEGRVDVLVIADAG